VGWYRPLLSGGKRSSLSFSSFIEYALVVEIRLPPISSSRLEIAMLALEVQGLPAGAASFGFGLRVSFVIKRLALGWGR
jgi:uncharacterized membrane protein